MKALSIFPAKVWLLALLSAFGCAHNNPVIEGQEITSQASLRPIDIEPSIAEKIGHEALQKVGYEEIIRLAEKAGFVAYKSDISIQLVSYGSAVASGFVPVFSRYAAAAAVTSQADSPLPGPADVAAVGVIVIGLVDAGLLDGYLLNTVGALLLGTRDKLLMSKAKTNEAKGTGGTTAAPGAERAGGETKAESADTTDPAADAEAEAKGGGEHCQRRRSQAGCRESAPDRRQQDEPRYSARAKRGAWPESVSPRMGTRTRGSQERQASSE